MILFPVVKFWRYSPLGWLCVVVWNLSEMGLFSLGNAAPWMFGKIIGCKGVEVKDTYRSKK